jgi:hypothetical protein
MHIDVDVFEPGRESIDQKHGSLSLRFTTNQIFCGVVREISMRLFVVLGTATWMTNSKMNIQALHGDCDIVPFIHCTRFN